MVNSDADRHDEEENYAAAGNKEEDTEAQIASIIRLEEVAVTTGEEDEDAQLYLKAKLYRFDKDGNQWKERGTGSVKLLKHKGTKKVRLVLRQAKNLKICANHYVIPAIKVQEHAGNEKSCVRHAPDFSYGEVKEEMFFICFGSVENNKKFMEAPDVTTADDASELLDKLTISETKSKEAPDVTTADDAEEEKPKTEPSIEEDKD